MADERNDIERYLKGEMSPAEMHALEKKALHDPFLADALEGGALFADEFENDIRALDDRIGEKSDRKRRRVRWSYQAAAAVVLMGISAITVYYLSGRRQAVTPITMNRQDERSVPEQYVPLADSADEAMADETMAAETDTREDAGAKEIEAPPSPSLQPEEPHAARARVADPEIQQEGENARDTGATPLPSVADRSADTMQVRSFALRQEAKKATDHVAGARAARQEAFAPSTARPQTVRGRVTDLDDGLPLPGVNVLVKGTGAGTVTDLNGNYELEVPDSTERLVFSSVGLQPREIRLSPGAAPDEVNVQLAPDVSSLSEVVVLGYGTESGVDPETASWEPAEPAGGKKAFRRYLESNMRYPETALENKVEGKVTIQFTIEPTGSLTDFRVIRSLGYGCDEEVIRLIREGPKWKPTKKNEEPVRGKGKVKLRFALPVDKK